MSRTLAGDVTSEVVKTATRPFHIAKLGFTSGDLFVSEGKAITYSSDSYVEGALRVGSLTWSSDGEQRADIALLDDGTGSTLSVALNNQIADTPVTVWLTYDTDPGGAGFATPTLLAKGVLNPTKITEDEVTMSITAYNVKDKGFPDQYVTKDNGFNYLMKEGDVVSWAGERYEIGGQ